MSVFFVGSICFMIGLTSGLALAALLEDWKRRRG